MGDMRKIIFIITLIFHSFILAKETRIASQEKPLVLTSLSLLTQIAQEIAQDEFQIQSLIDDHRDEHNFELKAKDLKLLQSSQGLILNGLQLEPWANNLIKKYKGDVIYAADGISGTNPHAWLNPRDGILYVENIAKILIRLKPKAASTINTRSDELKKKLLHLHTESVERFMPFAQSKIVISHASFDRLAKELNLEIYSPYSFGSEHEVSAKSLRTIIENVRKNKIKALFTEYGISDAAMKTISKETKIPISGVLYSDKFPKTGTVKSYFDMLKHNIDQIHKAL